MANKETDKVQINRNRFMATLKYRKSSIRKLGDAYNEVQRTEKTIRRYLGTGKMPPDLLDRIARHLNVETDFLSGKYDRVATRMSDDYLRKMFLSRLTPDNFPYIKTTQNTIGFDQHFQDILIMSGITIEQYKMLSWEKREFLRQDMAVAIQNVIVKYFEHDALGKKTFETLDYYESMVGDIDPGFAEYEVEKVIQVQP